MNVDDFINELNRLEKEMHTALGAHAPEGKDVKGGHRGHKPGAGKGCVQCIDIRKKAQIVHDFELTHLDTTRMAAPTIQNTVKLIRSIIKMMKEGGEI